MSKKLNGFKTLASVKFTITQNLIIGHYKRKINTTFASQRLLNCTHILQKYKVNASLELVRLYHSLDGRTETGEQDSFARNDFCKLNFYTL